MCLISTVSPVGANIQNNFSPDCNALKESNGCSPDGCDPEIMPTLVFAVGGGIAMLERVATSPPKHPNVKLGSKHGSGVSFLSKEVK